MPELRSQKYLPSFWHDDSAMQGYMSVIKARAVNPIDYDRKIRFWTNLISSSCEVEGNAIVSVDVLKRRFRRGDQLPSSIPVVCGVLMPLSKWQEQHSSWMGWSFQQLSKTSEWLFGTSKSISTERYIHLQTIKIQADELMKLYNKEFHSEVDGTGSIVEYSTFYDSAKDIVRTKENFDIVLAHLSDRGDVTIGQGRNGEQILKFRDSEEPVRFTEADASVHDIRRAMTKIEKDITVLERKAEKCEFYFKVVLDKTKAANLLRQKKHVQKDISDKDSQYQRLLTMLQQLAATKHNKEILDAYKAGTAAFRANLSRQGMTVEKIDEMMDDVANSIDEYREIEEAIGHAFVPKQNDDEDLEKELDELISKQKDSPAISNGTSNKVLPSLPEVPSNTLGYNDFEDEDALSLQKRLERLRSAT
ncbi:SNF7 family protein [Dictyocaulus viviparus]|uniref:SNF7 family protein n=1 Tax=Dictyocaulus viviparus TaxID=29172 RepID=A0A0D8Y5B9_DICVI|nr:SNF7 family protein [Dictyocaulus viviparus]